MPGVTSTLLFFLGSDFYYAMHNFSLLTGPRGEKRKEEKKQRKRKTASTITIPVIQEQSGDRIKSGICRPPRLAGLYD